MKLAAAKIMRDANAEMRNVEYAAGGAESMPQSMVRGDALRALGQEVSGSAQDWGEIEVPALRQALATIGAEVKKADANGDGKLDEKEQGKLSPMAARFLARAAGVPTRDIEIRTIGATAMAKMEKQLESVRRKYVAKKSWGWETSRIDLRDIPDPLARLVSIYSLARIYSPTGMWSRTVVSYDDMKAALARLREERAA